MKVARRLKYYSPDTDLSALQAELAGGDDPLITHISDDDDDEFEEDDVPAAGWGYAAWSEDEED